MEEHVEAECQESATERVVESTLMVNTPSMQPPWTVVKSKAGNRNKRQTETAQVSGPELFSNVFTPLRTGECLIGGSNLCQ